MPITTTTANNSSSEEPEKPKAQRKKRRWLRRLSWCLVLLAIITFFINGVVARKVVHYYLNQSLEDQGMSGSFVLNGSILSGFQVNDLNYSGDLGIQSLEIGQAAVDYEIMQLLDFKVDYLNANKLHATVDIAKFPPSDKPDETTNWKTTLNNIRPLLMHPKIGLEDINIILLNDGETVLQWELGSVQHESASDKIDFKHWTMTDASNRKTPEQSATLTWQKGKLEFDQLNLLPELSLSGILFDWESKIYGNARVNYRDTEIDVDIAETFTLELKNGEVKSAEIFKTLSTFGIDTTSLDMDLVLNRFNISIPVNDFEKSIPHWNIESSLGIQSARWQAYTLKDTNLNLSQKDLDYQLNINGSALDAPVKLDIIGNWHDPNTSQWWNSTTTKVSFQTTTNKEILRLIPQLKNIPQEINLNNSKLSGKVEASITDATLVKADGKIDLKGTKVKDTPSPNLSVSALYVDDSLEFKIMPIKSSEFLINGEMNPSTQEYSASLQIKADPTNSPWINSLAEAFQSPITLSKQIDIHWNGSGDIEDNTHQGKINTKNLTLVQKDKAPVTVNLQGNYNWPKSLEIETLSASQDELQVMASLLWNGKEISIRNSQVKLQEELIARVNGKLPFTAEIDSSKKFFAQSEPWDISIDTADLPLAKLAEMLPISNQSKLEGFLHTKLNITGNPHVPILNGDIKMKTTNDAFDIGLEQASLDAKLMTQDGILSIVGNLLESDQQRVEINLEFPFTPHAWLEDNKLLETLQKNSELKGTAKIKQLPLGRISKFIPELQKLEGVLDATAEFQGTIAEPKYKLDFDAKLPIINIKNSGIDDITDIHIIGAIDQTMVVTSDINAKINGGKFKVNVQVDIKDPKNPIFDVNLVTNYALIYRDDILVMRANANLDVKGTIEEATISGDIDILESLLYKDIDLIPIGAPSSAVGEVSLPSMKANGKENLPIPAPFNEWKLDLTVKTKDPILVRGNVGSGQVQGSIKVRGTLADPRPEGTLFAKKIKAKLPFSVLSVDNGQIIFSPNQGLIPTLEVRGKSQVGSYNVNLYAYGSADDPKIALSSFPALPENEIMTLLATGTTNSGLADRDVATFKTLQLLLLKLKQRNDRPGGNRLFRKILSGIEDLDLKVGEKNQLTGEKYASATIKLHQRWYLTAQIDNDQPPQTRGLIIFALKFR